jgi:anthranilate phosphoribosyltransferase
VSGRADKGRAGPGTDEQQKQRQDAQKHPKKSATQHIAELSGLDPENDAEFGTLMKSFARAKQDVASGAEREAIDLLVATKFAVRLGACTTLDRLEKGAAMASRLEVTGKALGVINEAIEAARVRLGSGQ